MVVPSIIQEIEGSYYLKELIYVIAYVIISQGWIQNFKICTVDILKYQTGSFRMLISDNIKKLNNIWASANILKYFYLSFNLQNDIEELIK